MSRRTPTYITVLVGSPLPLGLSSQEKAELNSDGRFPARQPERQKLLEAMSLPQPQGAPPCSMAWLRPVLLGYTEAGVPDTQPLPWATPEDRPLPSSETVAKSQHTTVSTPHAKVNLQRVLGSVSSTCSKTSTGKVSQK